MNHLQALVKARILAVDAVVVVMCYMVKPSARWGQGRRRRGGGEEGGVGLFVLPWHIALCNATVRVTQRFVQRNGSCNATVRVAADITTGSQAGLPLHPSSNPFTIS